MGRQIVNFQLPAGGRDTLHRALIECFLEEKPGTGKGDQATRYQYEVETYGKYAIFIQRPGWFNKGFDFIVCVREVHFQRNGSPAHRDIVDALQGCKDAYPDEYEKVKAAIADVYFCRETDLSGIQAEFSDFKGERHPIQILLLAIKWLFLEQDCAYWNYSGRRMLYEWLAENSLADPLEPSAEYPA